MKRLLGAILLLLSFSLTSQNSPNFINYQAVLRDNNGIMLPGGTNGTLQFKLYNNFSDVAATYVEDHVFTVPANNIVQLKIGSGNPVVGTFTSVTWTTGNAAYEVFLNGTQVGNRQGFASVPYSFYAQNTPPPAVSFTNNVLTVNGTSTPLNPTVTIPPTTITVANPALSSVTPSVGNNFQLNVASPVLNNSGNTIILTQGTYSTSTTFSPSSNPITIIPTGSLVSVTPTTGTSFNINVNTPTLSIVGNVLGIGPGGNNVTIPAPPSPTINGFGIASVSPTVGNVFNVTVPSHTFQFNPTSGIMSFSPSIGINTVNLNPNISYTNGILSVGASSVPLPGANIWTVPSASVVTLTNNTSSVGIGTNAPSAKLSLMGPLPNLLDLTVTSGNSNVNINANPVGTGDFQLRTSINGISFVTNSLSRLYINSSGQLGINTINPNAELTITSGTNTSSTMNILRGGGTPNGFSFQNNNAQSSILNYENTNLYLGTNGTNMQTFLPNGNVGIGTMSPTQKLEVSGNVIVPSANEYMYGAAKTKYFSMPAMAFRTEAPTAYECTFLAGCMYPSGTTPGTATYFLAPVNLPDGATVTAVTAYVVDNDVNYNISGIYLWQQPGTVGTPYGNVVMMANTGASANANPNIQTLTTTAITNPVINNSLNAYYVRVGLAQATTTGDIRLAKVVITYTINKAD